MRKLKVLPPMRCDEGCGACCGVAPVTETEFRRIERYVKDHGITPIRHDDDDEQCPLYQDGKCTVYPVRPLICRIFGHTERLTCERGYNVDVPQREIDRMVGANGRPTRVLHELVPSLAQDADRWKKLLPTSSEPWVAGGG
jgi:Fe-S-cluster containining protein